MQGNLREDDSDHESMVLPPFKPAIEDEVDDGVDDDDVEEMKAQEMAKLFPKPG